MSTGGHSKFSVSAAQDGSSTQPDHLVSFAIKLTYGLFWSAMFGSVASYIQAGVLT